MSTTRWSPVDDCGCSFDVDFAVQPWQGTVVAQCRDHADVSAAALFETVVGENLRRSHLRKFLVNHDEFSQPLVNARTGAVTRDLVDEIDLAHVWSGTGTNRILHMTVVGLTDERRELLQAYIDATCPGQIVLT